MRDTSGSLERKWTATFRAEVREESSLHRITVSPVSYTHLDVYKRQHVQISGRAVFSENWEGVEHLNALVSGSMGAFSVLGEKFQRASCDFSYDNGNFYVTDLDIRHPGGSFSGKVKMCIRDRCGRVEADAVREDGIHAWPAGCLPGTGRVWP